MILRAIRAAKAQKNTRKSNNSPSLPPISSTNDSPRPNTESLFPVDLTTNTEHSILDSIQLTFITQYEERNLRNSDNKKFAGLKFNNMESSYIVKVFTAYQHKKINLKLALKYHKINKSQFFERLKDWSQNDKITLGQTGSSLLDEKQKQIMRNDIQTRNNELSGFTLKQFKEYLIENSREFRKRSGRLDWETCNMIVTENTLRMYQNELVPNPVRTSHINNSKRMKQRSSLVKALQSWAVVTALLTIPDLELIDPNCVFNVDATNVILNGSSTFDTDTIYLSEDTVDGQNN